MAARKSFLVRLPPELLDEVRAWAEQEMRSTNAQIEWLLRDALRRRRGRAGDGDGPSEGTDEDKSENSRSD